ncbi:MAG: hypothetical protein ACOY3L_11360 [Pseudomonadota bacterium]
MTSYLVPAIMGAIGGILSWASTNFLGNPLIQFYQLRDEIHSALVLYANVSPVYESSDLGRSPKDHPDWERFVEAYGKLRELASQLHALAANHPYIRRALSCKGYELETAASDLRGFANTMGKPVARSNGELAWHRDRIERSLRFPLSYPNGVKIRDE